MTNEEGKGKPVEKTEEFVQLLSTHSRGIFQYILAQVIDIEAAEDLFQETNMVLWKEFDRFESRGHFRAWARKIAFNGCSEITCSGHRLQVV